MGLSSGSESANPVKLSVYGDSRTVGSIIDSHIHIVETIIPNMLESLLVISVDVRDLSVCFHHFLAKLLGRVYNQPGLGFSVALGERGFGIGMSQGLPIIFRHVFNSRA